MAFYRAYFTMIEGDERWGIAVISDETPLPGAVVPVTKRDGTVVQERIREVITSKIRTEGDGREGNWYLCRMARSHNLTYGRPVLHNDEKGLELLREHPGPQCAYPKGPTNAQLGLPKYKGRGGKKKPPIEERADFPPVLEALAVGHRWGQTVIELAEHVPFGDVKVRLYLKRAAELGYVIETRRTRHTSTNKGQAGALWKVTTAGLEFLTNPETSAA